MALLDSISFSSNNKNSTKWANGKTGFIIPTEDFQHIFVELELFEDRYYYKHPESEWKEKCPVIACGFVNHWLRHRKRNFTESNYFERFFPTGTRMSPKEIYDTYIEARKSWFLEYMNNRPDVWRYPDLEKLFYEQNLTTASEEELILKSEPLLDYLDEEDREEFIDVMRNFLDYVAYIVEPYQHVKENAIESFDKVMKPYGFYEIPKIKQLSRQAQCEFILKLLLSKIPFKVALLHYIEFMQYMEAKKGLETKAARLRLIGKAVGLKNDNRELKGNFNILKESSKEDPTKYTSYNHIDEAETFYLSLL